MFTQLSARLVSTSLWLCLVSTTIANAQTGWLREYIDDGPQSACSFQYCPFWEDLDRNGSTARIAAAGGHLYQLHSDGAIWKYIAPCSNNICSGWARIDSGSTMTKAIYADQNFLYKLLRDGSISRYNGTVWEQFPSYPDVVALAVADGAVGYLFADGRALYRKSETQIFVRDHPDAGEGSLVAIAVSGGCASCSMYVLTGYGKISERNTGGWFTLDNNPATTAIAAGGPGELYKLHSDGSIWQYNGFLFSWEKLDNNPATVRIVASNGELYQLHHNGSLWRYTGTPCDSNSLCFGWQLLLHDGVGRIAIDGNRLYELNQPVIASKRERVCYECLP
jgi:hypothetical protein